MADPLKLAALMAQAIGAIPNLGSVMWQHEMGRIITRGHTAAYIAGAAERLGIRPDSELISRSRLSKAERADIRQAVDAQLAYFAVFVQDLKQMSEAQIQARALMYAGATRETLYAARWSDWEIPDALMPGNQECLSRCLCTVSVKDNGDGTGVLTRVMGGTEHHCSTCPPLVGDHPVKRRGV